MINYFWSSTFWICLSLAFFFLKIICLLEALANDVSFQVVQKKSCCSI